MRVLFVSNYYPPFEIGGYEQLCRDVVIRFAARGHIVEVLTSNRGVKADAPLQEPGVRRLLHLQPIYELPQTVASQFFRQRRSDEAFDLECLRTAIEEFQPDVVFFWNLEYLPRSLALEAEKMLGGRVAYWLAGRTPAEPDEFWDYWKTSARKLTVRLVKSPLANLALTMMRQEGKPYRPQMRHVAVVSEFMRRQGIERGVLPDHTQVIYNGVELQLFRRPIRPTTDGMLTLLQAGRVSADKGVHTTIEAVGYLHRECGVNNIRLIVAGSGPEDYAANLRQIAEQRGIADRVSFLGWQPREKMPEVMAQCDVLVLPTENQEPFARVVLEAMASGLAVIGTLTGGTSEIIQAGVTGLTFAPGDSLALAHQIQQLATDSQLRIRLATAAQQLVLERFSLDHMIDRCEDLLQAAHADRTSSRGDVEV